MWCDVGVSVTLVLSNELRCESPPTGAQRKEEVVVLVVNNDSRGPLPER